MAETAEASTTLLCLKGLKSSLICTGGLFFNIRVPKKGLGGPVCTAGSLLLGLGLGETDAIDGPLTGDAAEGENGLLVGLNELAFTFSLLIPVGEIGVFEEAAAPLPLTPGRLAAGLLTFTVRLTLPAAVPVLGGDGPAPRGFFPLKGGMG